MATMDGVSKEDTDDAKKSQSSNSQSSENEKMDDAVDMGIAAAQTGSGVAGERREEFRKRSRDEDATANSKHNASSKQKTGHEDGYVTEASMKSSATLQRDNKHRGPDQQQLDYRDSVEKCSLVSAEMNDDDGSITSRNTWKSMASLLSHQKQLADRRASDKKEYAAMSNEERKSYNAKRRDKYHRQSQESRQKQRQRARNKYHTSGKGSVMSEAESVARKERREKLQQERIRSKEAIAATTDL